MSRPEGGLDVRRVVQVSAVDDDARTRLGSGYQVTEELVITAEHVVNGARAVTLRFIGDVGETHVVDGDIVWSDHTIDLAILRTSHPAPDMTRVLFGRLSGPTGCETVGFPRFKLREQQALFDGSAPTLYRDSHHAVGTCTPWSNRRSGTLEITVAPPDRDPDPAHSPWEGMSGAAVFAHGVLIALVSQHHLREGANRLTARTVEQWSRLAPERVAQLNALLRFSDTADLMAVGGAATHAEIGHDPKHNGAPAKAHRPELGRLPARQGLEVSRAAAVCATHAAGRVEIGSGYRVTSTTVITAAHVVDGAVSIQLRFTDASSRETTCIATSTWVDTGADLAVLRIDENSTIGAVGAPLPAVRYGRISRTDRELGCTTLGFPRFKLRGDGNRRDAHFVVGAAALWSNSREDCFEIKVPPPDGEEAERLPGWEGMPGAAVWSEGCLIGLIGRHQPGDEPGRLVVRRADHWIRQLTAEQTGELGTLIGLPSGLGGFATVADDPASAARATGALIAHRLDSLIQANDSQSPELWSAVAERMGLDIASIEALEPALADRLAADETFAAWLAGLDRGLGVHIHQTVNLFGGTAETVMQAGSVGALVVSTGSAAVQASGTPIVSQLRPALSARQFTNRLAEYRRLEAVLDGAMRDAAAGAPAVAIVTGMAGIGKTQLGLFWAHRVKDRFPDGQLFVNLHGFDPRGAPMPAAEALRSMLRELHPGETREISEEALSARFRTVLAGRRMLVFLDNAHDAAQIEPLLPADEKSMVLVTSRDRLADLDGVEPENRIDLDLLSELHSRELLGSVIGPEFSRLPPAKVAALLDGTGRLTLALRVVAQRIANKPQALQEHEVDQVVARLADDVRRFRTLDTPTVEDRRLTSVLAGSYAALGNEASLLFRRLGLHVAADFSRDAATALAGPDLLDVDFAIDDLCSAHLVEQISDDRYQLHDLVWAFARHLPTDPGERGPARSRLYSWYAQSVNAADASMRPGRIRPVVEAFPGVNATVFRDRNEAFRWCDVERDNLAKLVEAVAEHGGDELVWTIPLSMWGYLTQTRYWAEWVGVHQSAAQAAERCGQLSGAGWVWNNLGTAYRELGQPAESRAAFERGLMVREGLGDLHGQADSLKDMAVSARMTADFAGALELSDRAIAALGRLSEPDLSGTASVLDTKAAALAHFSRYDEAAQAVQEALAIWQNLDGGRDDRAWARATTIAADIAWRRGRVEQARAQLLDALSVFEAIQDRWGQAEVLRRLGDVFEYTGPIRMARAYRRQARECYAQLGAEQETTALAASIGDTEDLPGVGDDAVQR